MEPMVLCALGGVVFSGYLTAKEIAADLRREGWGLSLSIKHFRAPLHRVPARICPRGVPRSRNDSISFIYLRCRAALPAPARRSQGSCCRTHLFAQE